MNVVVPESLATFFSICKLEPPIVLTTVIFCLQAGSIDCVVIFNCICKLGPSIVLTTVIFFVQAGSAIFSFVCKLEPSIVLSVFQVRSINHGAESPCQSTLVSKVVQSSAEADETVGE